MSKSEKQGVTIIGSKNTVNNEIKHFHQSIPKDHIILEKKAHKQSIKDAVKIKELKMQAAHGEERARLQAEIRELNNRLADLPKALKEAQARIEQLEVILERESNVVGAEKITVAREALEKGNFSKADELFSEIEVHEEPVVQRVADVVFARGQIAEQEVRWKDAAQHYARAAHLNPCFETLMMAQKFAHATGDYPTATNFVLKMREIAKTTYGAESREYAVCFNNLGALYKLQGKYKKAESFYQQALQLHKKILGENHPGTATNIDNIAVLYLEQKQYKKALPLFHQALEIYKKTIGENNPHAAICINNIASIYQKLRQYETAELLHNKALNIRKALFGDDHPEIANTMNNLAGVYYEQGKYKKAEEYFEKSLKIHQKLLGNSHPSTGIHMRNLGGVYEKQGQYKKAKPLYKQAAEILETTLGSEHPTTKRIKAAYEDFLKKYPNV